jgi:U3 small nucleolar RNA-associated protein 24
MGKLKKGKTKAFAAVKRMISPKDARIKKPTLNPNQVAKQEREKEKASTVRNVTQTPSSLFFSHNMALGPPYHVLIDTNFINFSIQNKLDIMKSLMDCLYAKVTSPRTPVRPTRDRKALTQRAGLYDSRQY